MSILCVFQIRMADIWGYEPGRLIPHVEFMIKWKRQGSCSDTLPEAIVTGALFEKKIALRISGLLYIYNYVWLHGTDMHSYIIIIIVI